MAETYVPAKPCRRGHLSPRYVNGGACIECLAIKQTEYRAANRERKQEADRAWRARNAEKVRKQSRRSSKEWYTKHKDYIPSWRERNPESVSASQLRTYEKGKERLDAARSGGCADCGATEDLHFHHLDPSTKLYHVAEMHGNSDATFYEEVAKCALVCQPCHMERHRQMSQESAA